MKSSIIYLVLFLLLSFNKIFAAAPPPPPNDDCANAQVISLGSQVCNQNLLGSTFQTGECVVDYAGLSESGSGWFYFNATQTNIVLNYIVMNNACNPYVAIYGPFSSVSAGCSNILGSGCSQELATGTVLATAATPTPFLDPIATSYSVITPALDPGVSILLSGLNTTAGNNTYLIQMVNIDCGTGPSNDPTHGANLCLATYTPGSNTTPSGASIINACGTQYNGTSVGGYYPSNSLNNIDNNSSTSCPPSFGNPPCTGSNGIDVPFAINNPSYFTFCAAANGTYNINFDVGTCTQTLTTNQGAQMAILIGSTSSMTLNQVAPNPMLPSSPIWTSSNFSLATGQCAYLVVDGFKGDQCTYSYTLNNVGGGCLLPIELITFSVDKNFNYNKIFWSTATEKNNAYFTLEKSSDGINYAVLGKIAGAGDSYIRRDYEYIDEHPYSGITYYQLSQTDYDGTTKKLGIVAVQNDIKLKDIEIKPNPTSETAIISIPSHKQKDVTIRLTDIAGKIIEEKNVSLESGDNYYEIRLSPLEKGLYFVQITGRDINQSFKLVKE